MSSSDPGSQRVRDVAALVGSAVLSALWFWYTSLRHDPDYRSCVALVATPLSLIVFRTPIDGLLRPLQPVLDLVPSLLRYAIGLLLPFVVCRNIQDALGGTSGVEYPYFFRVIVLGTITSYAWLRQPPTGAAP